MGQQGDDDIDPRIPRTLRRVRQATLDELAEVGYGAFTVESVAARAGASKSTMYRHWQGGKLALIADALETMNEQPRPEPGDGTAHQRAAVLMRHLTGAMADPTLSAAVPALVEAAERDATIARFHHAYSDRRRQTLVDVLREGVASGELPSDLDPELAALSLAGAVVYRRLMTAEPFPDERVDALVDQVLGPRAGSGSGGRP